MESINSMNDIVRAYVFLKLLWSLEMARGKRKKVVVRRRKIVIVQDECPMKKCKGTLKPTKETYNAVNLKDGSPKQRRRWVCQECGTPLWRLAEKEPLPAAR